MSSTIRRASSSGKRPKFKEKKGNKVSLEKAYNNILVYVKEQSIMTDRVYAESISEQLNIRLNIVKKTLHQLNLDGYVSNAIRWERNKMHTRNDEYGDMVIKWQAKHYLIRK